jgi:two-component system chemotaxis response regulator CheB
MAQSAFEKIIVVGSSVGGMRALEKLLAGLSGELRFPIVIVQHRGADSGRVLSKRLEEKTSLTVSEPFDKEEILSQVYIAPADYHLLIEGDHFALSTDEPESFARPSIDVFFESAADAMGERVICLVLTGAAKDGARGAARIKRRGGRVIVQEPSTAESDVLPRATIEATEVDAVMTVEEMSSFLLRLGWHKRRGRI